MLIGSNMVFTVGLAVLSQAQQPLHNFAAWAFISLAFATAVLPHGEQSVQVRAFDTPWLGLPFDARDGAGGQIV